MLLNPETWPRRAHYEHFMGYDRPWFTLTVRVPCEAVFQRAKAEGLPVFATMLHGAVKAAHSEPALCQRLRPDGVWQHHTLHPSYTSSGADDAFRFQIVPFDEALPRFLHNVEHTEPSGDLSAPLDAAARDDLLFVSCLPWIELTHVEPALRNGRYDSVPMLHWGKITDGHVHVSLTAHHALVDGLHASRFFRALSALWGTP